MHRYNTDYPRHTALALGVCHGLENVVRRPLAAKPGDINAKFGSIRPICDEPLHIPLCYAVGQGQIRAIELLLDEGANIHAGTELDPDQFIMLLGRVMRNVWRFLSKKALMSIKPHMVRPQVKHGPALI
ncbi:hypothetical protein GB937_008343 [Aspergillus fischeri]|nr:hypothetical protein GB937_008343 [Aspergillus fischeri]